MSQVLLLLSFANGMPGAEDTLLERAFSLTIAGEAAVHTSAEPSNCRIPECPRSSAANWRTYVLLHTSCNPARMMCICKQVWLLVHRAGSGLIAFALTVALVQQSVRGAIEANVQTGGALFEIDHVRHLPYTGSIHQNGHIRRAACMPKCGPLSC